MDKAKLGNLLIAGGLIIVSLIAVSPLINSIDFSAQSSAILAKPEDMLVQPQMTSFNIEQAEDILKALSGYGSSREKKFLILSQDPLEIRPTGGFAGTYGEIAVNGGDLLFLKYDDIWKLDKRLKKEGVQQINQSQWWTHFPRAAQEAMISYKKATGVSLDGVVAMDPTAMSYILEVIGPVKVDKFDETVNSKNLLEKILKYSPYVKDKATDKPLHKQFLAAAAQEIQKQLFTFSSFTKRKSISKAVLKSLEEKHMLFYFNDKALEDILIEHNWAGQLRDVPGDFLSVIDYNAGINKVNIFVDRDVKYKASVLEDGRVIGKITTTYFYNTSKTAYKKYGRLYGDKHNVYRNIQRVYVPEGTKLLSAKNYDEPQKKSTENGKTAFKSMFTLSPGQKRQFEISYETPSMKKGEYSLLFQKQPGTPIDSESAYRFEAQVVFPQNARIDTYFPKYKQFTNNRLIFESNCNNDFQTVILFTI